MPVLSVLSNNGSPAAPGAEVDVFVIAAMDVTTYPQTRFENNASNATPTDKKTLNAAFVLASGAGWVKMRGKVNTPKGTQTLTGDGGAAGFENKVEVSLCGDGAELRNLGDELAKLKRCGSGVYVLLTNPETGDRDVLGRKGRPAELAEFSLATGDKPGGEARESKVSFMAVGQTMDIYPAALAVTLAT